MQIHKQEFDAIIGLDWADKKHDICLMTVGEAGQRVAEYAVIKHDPGEIQDWARRLRERFGQEARIAVALELERGPVVSALLEYDIFVLFPVRPDGLAKYRQTFTPSRAKDDPSDAFLAADFVRRHPERFSPLKPERPQMRQLRRLVQDRRQLVQDRTRLVNRLTWHLKAYHPLVLSLFRDKFTDVFLDFVDRWPTLDALKRARPDTLRDFFRSNNVRHSAVIEKRLGAIAEARPLTRDMAVIEPSVLMVRGIIGQLRQVNKAVVSFDEAIEAICAKLPDYAIFKQLPGAGAALAPRLLAAFGENRERFPTAASMQKYAGVAPVTERSGQKSWVHWRFICSTFLRQSFVEWVGETIPRSFWAKAFYERYKAKGVSHNAAIRALAFKWIRILWRCWVDRTAYDESTYLAALKKRGSPLLKFAADSSP